jgi:hypothetical protein
MLEPYFLSCITEGDLIRGVRISAKVVVSYFGIQCFHVVMLKLCVYDTDDWHVQ